MKEKVELARTSITLNKELLERFKGYCDKNHRSVSAQVALMIEEIMVKVEVKE
jgi:hypothetical protein